MRSPCPRRPPKSRCRNCPPPATSLLSPRRPAMFDDLGSYLWLIPTLPLAASALTAFLGPRFLRQNSHWPCILAAAASCVLSVLVLAAVAGGRTDITEYYTWFQVPGADG